jgi:beta-lactam-binding protein with PASTA domain
MLAFVLLIFVGVLLWLRGYTNHGQKLELPNYKNAVFEEAKLDAKKKSFELIVNDSIFKVGLPGGIILNQNPKPGSLVKEKRKVYVDISRYNATTNNLSEMPIMYGREYNGVKRSLSHLEIESSIKSYKYDAGEPDHILEVWYKGSLIDGKSGRKSNINIETGGTLEFVLSRKEGGETYIPELTCLMLKQAKWRLQVEKLKLGNVEKHGVITNLDSAYVVSQFPMYSDSTTISMGKSVNVVVQPEKPADCK